MFVAKTGVKGGNYEESVESKDFHLSYKGNMKELLIKAPMTKEELFHTLPVQWREPIHSHTCKHCIFLGCAHVGNCVRDLYYCPNEPTVLANYGENYTSGLILVGLDPFLTTAYYRAQAIGLV